MQRLTSGLLIHSSIVDVSRALTTFHLYTMFLAVIVLPALLVGALRSGYAEADVQLRLQTWQLQQLVPDEAAQPIRPPDP